MEGIDTNVQGHIATGVFFLMVATFAHLEQIDRRRTLLWGRLWNLLAVAVGAVGIVVNEAHYSGGGGLSWWDMIRDPQVIQHKIAATMICLGGGCEALSARFPDQRLFRLALPGGAALIGGMLVLHSPHAGHGFSAILNQMTLLPSESVRHLIRVQHLWMATSCLVIASLSSLRHSRSTAARRASRLWPLGAFWLGALLFGYREP